jgi:hypothetical protein
VTKTDAIPIKASAIVYAIGGTGILARDVIIIAIAIGLAILVLLWNCLCLIIEAMIAG